MGALRLWLQLSDDTLAAAWGSMDRYHLAWLSVGKPKETVRGRPMTADEEAAYVREVAEPEDGRPADEPRRGRAAGDAVPRRDGRRRGGAGDGRGAGRRARRGAVGRSRPVRRPARGRRAVRRGAPGPRRGGPPRRRRPPAAARRGRRSCSDDRAAHPGGRRAAAGPRPGPGRPRLPAPRPAARPPGRRASSTATSVRPTSRHRSSRSRSARRGAWPTTPLSSASASRRRSPSRTAVAGSTPSSSPWRPRRWRWPARGCPISSTSRPASTIAPTRTPEAELRRRRGRARGAAPRRRPAPRSDRGLGRAVHDPGGPRAGRRGRPAARAPPAGRRDLFGLPDGEDLAVSLVRDQPWSGYNWYDGGRRSRVELNTDLPIRAADLLSVLPHETYPGHHLEHAWHEAHLVDGLGRMEASVLCINAPECLLSEGLADLGRRFAVPPDQEVDILAEVYRLAALPDLGDAAAARETAERQVAISRALAAVRGVAGNAALMLHADGAAARRGPGLPGAAPALDARAGGQAPRVHHAPAVADLRLRLLRGRAPPATLAGDGPGGGAAGPFPAPPGRAAHPVGDRRGDRARSRSGARRLTPPRSSSRRSSCGGPVQPCDRTAAPGRGGQPEVARSSSTRSSPSPSQSANAGIP